MSVRRGARAGRARARQLRGGARRARVGGAGGAVGGRAEGAWAAKGPTAEATAPRRRRRVTNDDDGMIVESSFWMLDDFMVSDSRPVYTGISLLLLRLKYINTLYKELTI